MEVIKEVNRRNKRIHVETNNEISKYWKKDRKKDRKTERQKDRKTERQKERKKDINK